MTAIAAATTLAFGQHLLVDQLPSMALQPKWIHKGCADVACLVAMGKTLTLKNLPEELHARLSAAARRHRRSLNQEAIFCLESGLGAEVPSVEEELARIRIPSVRKDVRCRAWRLVQSAGVPGVNQLGG